MILGIPTLNRYDKLHHCLESAGTVPVVIVDNGGFFVTSHKNTEIVRPTQALGVYASWQLLCDIAMDLGETTICIANDDVTFVGDTLQQLEDSALSGCFASPLAKQSNEYSCFAMSLDTHRKIGSFDCNFAIHCGDDDYRWRVDDLQIERKRVGQIQHQRESTLHNLNTYAKRLYDDALINDNAHCVGKWHCLYTSEDKRVKQPDTSTHPDGVWRYTVDGHSTRKLHLASDNRVYQGVDSQEQFWCMHDDEIRLFSHTQSATLTRQNDTRYVGTFLAGSQQQLTLEKI